MSDQAKREALEEVRKEREQREALKAELKKEIMEELRQEQEQQPKTPYERIVEKYDRRRGNR